MIGAEYKYGESRISHLERQGRGGFKRFFKFSKVSHGKYRIEEIYETPLPAIDDRSLGNARGIHKLRKKTKEIPNLDIQEDAIALNAGVYKIENDDSVYIGSTVNKLVDRFKSHCKNATGMQPKTQEMIQNNGVFTCLESFPLGTDEQTIRDREAYYIWKYQEGDKELINSDLPELIKGNKHIKYENLKIPFNLYDEAIKCLRENGFLIMDKSVYDKRFKEVK